MIDCGVSGCTVRRCVLVALILLASWIAWIESPAYATPGVAEAVPQVDPAPVTQAVAPVLDAAPAQPAAERAAAPATKQVAQAVEPVVQAAEPATKQVAQAAEPVVKSAAPATNQVAQAAEPATDPVVKTLTPVTKNLAPTAAGKRPSVADAGSAPHALEPSAADPAGSSLPRTLPSTVTAVVPPAATTDPIAPGARSVDLPRGPLAHDGLRLAGPRGPLHVLTPGTTTPFSPAAATQLAGSATIRHESGTRQAGAEQPAAPPVGVAAAAAATTTASATALAILFLLLLVPCLRYGRVALAPARWRSVLFVSLLERPG